MGKNKKKLEIYRLNLGKMPMITKKQVGIPYLFIIGDWMKNRALLCVVGR